MKKVTYALIGFLLLLATQSKSQNLIALQTGGIFYLLHGNYLTP